MLENQGNETNSFELFAGVGLTFPNDIFIDCTVTFSEKDDNFDGEGISSQRDQEMIMVTLPEEDSFVNLIDSFLTPNITIVTALANSSCLFKNVITTDGHKDFAHHQLVLKWIALITEIDVLLHTMVPKPAHQEIFINLFEKSCYKLIELNLNCFFPSCFFSPPVRETSKFFINLKMTRNLRSIWIYTSHSL